MPRDLGSNIERHSGILSPSTVQKLNNRLGQKPVYRNANSRNRALCTLGRSGKSSI